MSSLLFKIVRRPSDSVCTIGELYASEDNGTNWARLCWTLEDVVRENVNLPVSAWKVWGETAIPLGTYKVTVRWSNHFQKMLPHIEQVPGFSEIMLHGGNRAEDTHGCPLCAHNHPCEDVIQGNAVDDTILPLLKKHGNEATITIEGRPAVS